MAQTANTIDLMQAGPDGAQPSSNGPRVDAAAAARKQVLEFARALARLAAQEDDASERNEAGSAARSEACAASATGCKDPMTHG